MNKFLIAMGLVLVTASCETCKQHPGMCAVAGTIIAGSLAACFSNSHKHTGSSPGYTMSTPLTPNCQVYPEMCK